MTQKKEVHTMFFGIIFWSALISTVDAICDLPTTEDNVKFVKTINFVDMMEVSSGMINNGEYIRIYCLDSGVYKQARCGNGRFPPDVALFNCASLITRDRVPWVIGHWPHPQFGTDYSGHGNNMEVSSTNFINTISTSDSYSVDGMLIKFNTPSTMVENALISIQYDNEEQYEITMINATGLASFRVDYPGPGSSATSISCLSAPSLLDPGSNQVILRIVINGTMLLYRCNGEDVQNVTLSNFAFSSSPGKVFTAAGTSGIVFIRDPWQYLLQNSELVKPLGSFGISL